MLKLFAIQYFSLNFETMNIEGFFQWALFVALVFVLVSVMAYTNTRLLKSSYRYWWVIQTLIYPYTRILYKKRLRYLSVKELDDLTDKLVSYPDTWFVRELLVLVINQRLKLEDYV